MLWSSISQKASPAVPLCLVHLLEVPMEVTGDDVIPSYFLIGKPGGMQQTLGRGSGQMGGHFQAHTGVLPTKVSLLPLLVVSRCIASLTARWW